MKFKKIVAYFLIAFILIGSQSKTAYDLFDKSEKTLFENEYYRTISTNGSVSVSCGAEISSQSKKVSLLNNVVNIKKDKEVYLGGQTVGIAFYTKGLYITDIVPIEDTNSNYRIPANDAGLKVGDYIISANGVELKDISNLDAVLKASKGNSIKIDVLRGEKRFFTEIKPIKNIKTGNFSLGLWLRDSAAGLGTVRYVDPQNNSFAALGHSICDGDTGEMLSVSDGRIVECNITGVKKGGVGFAGELKGSFGINAKQLGEIKENTKFGIKGTVYNLENKQLIQLGSKEFVHEGEAFIYSDFNDGKIQKYSVKILHVNDQTYPCEKSMVIKITDDDLIEKTGGIVQGLSGSPIVQDGKLIGAVTHVMINDPTKGYGIFIENMLEGISDSFLNVAA